MENINKMTSKKAVALLLLPLAMAFASSVIICNADGFNLADDDVALAHGKKFIVADSHPGTTQAFPKHESESAVIKKAHLNLNGTGAGCSIPSIKVMVVAALLVTMLVMMAY